MEIDKRYTSEFRNQYHYSDVDSWLNDPNGMIYYEGVYHLFYQKSIGVNCNTDYMSWGHATSKDLIHFKQEEDAIKYDEKGSIWSGSCVVDYHNDSQLFEDEKGGLVAFYTLKDHDQVQQQAMAYSKDFGMTWVKYKDGNPIITREDDPLKESDFRDPKVFYSEEFHKYIMLVAGGHLRIYSSDNLLDWQIESYDENINTECPDIFSLKADDGVIKQVLSCGGRNYLVGHLKSIDGKIKFVPDSYSTKPFNFGIDAYATQTFNNTDRIMGIAWMNNWEHAGKCAYYYDDFNGSMSLLYEYSLIHENGEYFVYQNPIHEYEQLRILKSKKEISSNALIENDIFTGRSFETEIELDRQENMMFKINLCAKDSTLSILYDDSLSVVSVDRSKQKNYTTRSFLSKYSTKIDQKEKIHFKIYVDRSSCEVIMNHGKQVGSFVFFPEGDVTINIDSNVATNYHVISYSLNSIWMK